jgi:hypothetical protein
MRFRAKFGALDWCWIGTACLFAALWFSGHLSGIAGLFALYFVSMTAFRALSQVFIYWEIDSERLRERRLWHTKEIPWPEIVHVASWHPRQVSHDYLEIDYARPAPMSDRGSVFANPEDRTGFLAALHRFATEADFEG